ncbi:MAG: alanine--glyoxylate aminotransferase family protein [Oligoflexia bacterium]|nr:alanine--glyoxylate aminotransferase family protein [Oligoflexia bacterium]
MKNLKKAIELIYNYVDNYDPRTVEFSQRRQICFEKNFPLLFCPGPVRVSDAVKMSMLHPDLGHREEEFSTILKSILENAKIPFGVANNNNYEIVTIIGGSGSAANESIISSFKEGTKILIPTNGIFGEALVKTAIVHKLDVKQIDFGWGNSIDLNVVEQKISSNIYEVLMMVHHETSTGQLNPIKEVAAICRLVEEKFNSKIFMCVDAVSSAGAESIDVEKFNISFCSTQSGKALLSDPGVGIICARSSDLDLIRERKYQSGSKYLALNNQAQIHREKVQTLNTPAIGLAIPLDIALKELKADGLELRKEIYLKYASKIRLAAKEMELKTVIDDEQCMSRVLTTFYYPQNINVDNFHNYIRNKNIIIYRGKGPIAGKAFQLANIGYLTFDHIDYLINSIKEALRFSHIP